jgi:hypothetical protein
MIETNREVPLIKATRFATDLGTPPPQYAAGRVCADCDTVLSVYNGSCYCAAHEPEVEDEHFPPQILGVFMEMCDGGFHSAPEGMSNWQWNSMISVIRGRGHFVEFVKGKGHRLLDGESE